MPMTWAILELANDTFIPQDANGYWVYAIGTLDEDNGTDTTLADITVHDSVAVNNVDDYGSIYQSSGAAKRDITHEFSVTNFTSIGIDRASDELMEARLDVCRNCPGNHAVWKNGDVHTCGPMLASMKGEGGGTCGCVLRKKAPDAREDCPFGWW